MNKICLYCNTELKRKNKEEKKDWDRRKYCNHTCHWKSMIGQKKSLRWKTNMSKAKKGNKNPAWKGGKQTSTRGYIYIWQPHHPFSTKPGYVLEHHLVMEKHLGRYLKPGEVVHHKGIKYPLNSVENKQDNRIENLRLFSSKSKHTEYHWKLQ